jgi:aspartate beta-hydroxylase
MRTGQRQAAGRQWEEVLALAPEHPAALNGLGVLALSEDRKPEAAALFRRAAESDPQATTLWLNHAKLARDLGDDDAEKDSLSRAIAIEPMSLVINVRLAEHAERTGDLGGASEKWRAVVALADSGREIMPDIRPAVDHARRYVATQSADLEARISQALDKKRQQMASAERRRIDAAVDHMFGRRPFYVNQCSGLHVPFLPADEYFDRSLFPWLPSLEAATDIIRLELVAALDGGAVGFKPYVQLPPGTQRNVWSKLDRSPDWNTLHLWRHGKRDEDACARFPKTAALLETLPLAHLRDRMPTIFFSILAPHAHIPPHTGVTNARAIVHLPLVVPAGCRFRVGGETRPWIEGTAMAFDDTIEHEAWNDSDHPRIILIMDTWNPHLTDKERELLGDFYALENDPSAG